jgi:hypothetical protein
MVVGDGQDQDTIRIDLAIEEREGEPFEADPAVSFAINRPTTRLGDDPRDSPVDFVPKPLAQAGLSRLAVEVG